MQITSANLIAFGRDLKQLYDQQMGEGDFAWSPEQVSKQESSSVAAAEYWWPEADEKMRNWTGKQKEIANLLLRGFVAANQDFERTFSIDLKDLERNEARKVRSLMEALTTPARYWKRQMIVEALLNGGFCNDAEGKPITFTWIDGRPYFDDQHLANASDPNSKKWANKHTSTPLTGPNVVKLRRKMMTVPGISGRPMGYMPKQIWIPPSLMQTALEISKGQTIFKETANGAAAPDNVLRIFGLEVVEIPEIEDDTGTWYLRGTKLGRAPVVVQVEKEPVFASNAGSLANRFDGEIDSSLLVTEKVLGGVSARGVAFLTAPEVLHQAIP